MSEVREGVTVVTNENIEQFIDEKLGETAPPEAEPEKVEKTEVETSAVKEAKPEETTEDDNVEVKKTKKELRGIEKRMHELVEDRKTAYTERQEAVKRAEEAEARAREIEAKYNPPKTPEGQKPSPDQYMDINDYSQALEKWTTEQTEKRVKNDYETKEQQRENERRSAKFKENLEKGKSDLPDYDEVVSKADVKVSDELQAEIMDSENPAVLIHYFASNPQEAERLAKLTVGGMIREVGKLEVKLAKPSTKSAETDHKTEISKAPKPISTLKGGGSISEVPQDGKGEFTGTYSDYKALRQAGKIK